MLLYVLNSIILYRCPVFSKERALYLASLGPNYTNLADCILNTVKPDFAPLIASGALNGVREVKYGEILNYIKADNFMLYI